MGDCLPFISVKVNRTRSLVNRARPGQAGRRDKIKLHGLEVWAGLPRASLYLH